MHEYTSHFRFLELEILDQFQMQRVELPFDIMGKSCSFLIDDLINQASLLERECLPLESDSSKFFLLFVVLRLSIKVTTFLLQIGDV